MNERPHVFLADAFVNAMSVCVNLEVQNLIFDEFSPHISSTLTLSSRIALIKFNDDSFILLDRVAHTVRGAANIESFFDVLADAINDDHTILDDVKSFLEASKSDEK